jgi:hypothetical protein
MGVNLDLLSSHAHFAREDDPVYVSGTHLQLACTCQYPPERAGQQFELKILGESLTARRMDIRIKDLRQLDAKGVPQFRKTKEGMYPVYKEPPPISYLDKVRGENRWTAWLWVSPQTVTDTLLMLSGGKTVYVAITERKVERQRRVHNISIQTTDPAEE